MNGWTPAFWSSHEQTYVAFIRTWKDAGKCTRAGWGGNLRWVGRLTSPDFVHWEAWVRNGLGPEHWTSRTNYPALNIVPTSVAEMSVYVTQESDRYALRFR